MNERQSKLFHQMLIHNNEVLQVRDLADQLECSEKTLRNDLKVVEDYLYKNSQASLVRKPGVGISLYVEEAEKARLYQELFQTERKDDQERLVEIAYRMLSEEKPFTLQDLAAAYFITIPQIKKDLEVLNRWLGDFKLEICSKQRLGSTVIGRELAKRNAIAHLPELASNTRSDILQLFPEHEVDIVRQGLEKLQDRFLLEFAPGELESLIIHALVMIKRTRQRSTISIKTTDQWTTEEFKAAGYFLVI
ncbi:HTH domain-containing protein [Halobacillus sp. Marseille-Q1614]|uniref:BglG family transcription antiterminator n=1 Tax=Halobacillus sp. Marseille-Q1614 TaxID=2709134 RepID=UPI00157141F9|nr:HTH domain-containing protein [Halobacillus sp. Marseille-Q1614]